MCVVVGCGSKSDTAKGIGMFRIPSIIKNQGEEMEELTTLRHEKWISAISRDDTMHKNVLQSERVCGRHFVSGRPSQHWDKHNVDWIPTLNLGKKEYRERNPKAATERAERAKARQKSTIEQQERESAKRKLLNESGARVASVDFSENAASTSDQNADTQKAENVEMIEPEPEDASTAFVNEELELQQGENIKRLIGTLKLKQRRSIICTGKLAIIKHLTGMLKPRQKSLTISSRRVADIKLQTEIFSNQMIGSDFTQDFLHTRCSWQSLNMLSLMLLAASNHWTGFKNL